MKCHYCSQQAPRQDRADVTTPQFSHQTRSTAGMTSCAWLLTMAFIVPALAGETDTPRRHSLIHRPAAPVSPEVTPPRPSTLPTRPNATLTPSVMPPSSLSLRHKLTKKPISSATITPLFTDSTPSPAISSRLPSVGNLPSTVPPTVSDAVAKITPASAGGSTIVPIATTSSSMASLGNAAQPASSHSSLAAATQSTAVASTEQRSVKLSPSMARLAQMSPSFAALLQPSTPIVTPPSTPPPSTPLPPSSTGSATLSWSANGESDLSGYKVYWGTSSGNYTSSGSPAAIGKVTSYTVTGLQRNTTYFFAISAYDNAGNESPLSAEASKSIL